MGVHFTVSIPKSGINPFHLGKNSNIYKLKGRGCFFHLLLTRHSRFLLTWKLKVFLVVWLSCWSLCMKLSLEQVFFECCIQMFWMLSSTHRREQQSTPLLQNLNFALGNSESPRSLLPCRIGGLYTQVQSTFSRFLQGKGRVDALIKPVPDDEEHLSSLSVYKQQPLGGVVQQDAHSGGTLSHVDIAHNATVEKCVSEMEQNGKWKLWKSWTTIKKITWRQPILQLLISVHNKELQ